MSNEALKILINKLKTLADVVETEGEKLMTNEAGFVADMNINQLSQGIRATGRKINPPYAKKTIKIKQKKGQIYKYVTLRDTGDFYNSIRARVLTFRGYNGLVTFRYSIDATDEKYPDLAKKYGEILGVTAESRKLIMDRISPELKSIVRRHLSR